MSMRTGKDGLWIVLAVLALGQAATVALAAAGAPRWEAKDLNPVRFKKAPDHAPVVLFESGRPPASIVVMGRNDKVAKELQRFLALATGTNWPIVTGPVTPPAIVIGDGPPAAAQGVVGSNMPPEAFTIKTAPGLVFIAGNNGGPTANGTLWGVYEFLERFVGMRWYFPQAVTNGPELGLDVPAAPLLSIPPVWIEDAPVFRLRDIYPPWSNPWSGSGIPLVPLQTFLRAGSSWPIRLKVHQPNWSRYPELTEKRPEVFQMQKDGTRQFNVLCYGNPATLEVYLEGIQAFLDKRKPVYAPFMPNRAITVSPADVELACYCPDCQRLWDQNGGQYGGASRVMATFVDKLARAVKERWPNEGFTIIYLPYLNYTAAPDGFKFPDNVEVQLCGMPGLATYKEPAIRDAEQANIDKWLAISGRRVQNWHYNVWPAHKTKAAYHYPHVIQDFYRRNRDKTVGTFINGDYNHWPRQHISLYCWLKLLWNPDYDVDAAVDAFCTRMFGPASKTMRELVGLQMDGWEKSRWPGERFSPKGIYEVSYPSNTVTRMKALIARARDEARDDALVIARLDYYENPTLKDFFEEAAMMSGAGFKPLQAQKVGEAPIVDGKLDEPAWDRAPSNVLVVAGGKDQGKTPKYPTSVKAVWTPDGITFGFRMTEPTPELLDTRHGGHDNGEVWWDDNVEVLLDVTGKREGLYHHFIVNADGNYWDSKLRDATWECAGFKAKAFRGPDFWSMEIFLPYAAFPEASVPGSGTHTKWAGNFTRHRVADKGLKPTAPPQEGSTREYQRMNTLGATASDNLADFSAIEFIE